MAFSIIALYVIVGAWGNHFSSMPKAFETASLLLGLSKSPPPYKPAVLLNALEPIALHCPVIEFAPVPALPIFPVSKAKAIIDCAVLTAS